MKPFFGFLAERAHSWPKASAELGECVGMQCHDEGGERQQRGGRHDQP
ncbi:MAG: hypothetical protein ACRDPC_08880 [Solirubrobacteraceae bacterium]